MNEMEYCREIASLKKQLIESEPPSEDAYKICMKQIADGIKVSREIELTDTQIVNGIIASAKEQ